MAIRFPKSIRWNGREIPVEGAMERALREAGNPPEEPEPPQTPTGDMPNLNGFVSVKPLGIYVAKNRDLNNLSWNQAIDKIYNQGISVNGQRAEMPTPFEFMSYITFLLSGNTGLPEAERKTILDDILKTGDYRGNYLNAKFTSNAIEMAIIKNSKLEWMATPLLPCLQKNCYADLRKINSQGLFTIEATKQEYIQGQTAYFWKPVNGYVARFDAGSVRADLSCGRGPGNSYASLGVRLVVRPKGVSPKNK